MKYTHESVVADKCWTKRKPHNICTNSSIGRPLCSVKYIPFMLPWLRIFFGSSKDNSLKSSIQKSIRLTESIVPLRVVRNESHSKASLPKRRQYSMLFPRDTVFLWRDLVDPKKNLSSRCISAIFCIEKDGKQFPISLKRQLDDDFSSTHLKILSKINQALSDDAKNKKVITNLSSFAEPEFSPNVSFVQKTVEEVFDSSTEIIIMGRKCSIIREPVDISSITCLLYNIVDSPVVPAIDFRDNSCPSTPTIHWFVKSQPDPLEETAIKKKKSKTVPPVPDTITLIDGPKRTFKIDNCEFRCVGPTYTPSSDDVGKRLVVLADLGEQSIVKTGVSKYPVCPLPKDLLTRPITDWCSEQPSQSQSRIVSYNILADLYLNLAGLQKDLFFPYCPKNYQHYEYRYPLLLREIQKFGADIYFLQEVDQRMQIRYLSTVFREKGLEMMFAKKGAEVSEGSVIAFRKDKFSQKQSQVDVLSDLLRLSSNEDILKMMETSEYGLKILSSRPTIIQTVLLQSVDNGVFTLCANTHLHHDPKHEYIKAVQALLAHRRIEEIKHRFVSDHPQCSIRVIFAGDFNSTPNGPVFKLFSTGFLAKEDDTVKQLPSLKAEDLFLKSNNADRLRLHNLTGTPDYTNYTRYKKEDGTTHGFSGCLDYIWSDKEAIDVLRPPPVLHEDVIKFEALPSQISPSDHVPLVIDMNLSK